VRPTLRALHNLPGNIRCYVYCSGRHGKYTFIATLIGFRSNVSVIDLGFFYGNRQEGRNITILPLCFGITFQKDVLECSKNCYVIKNLLFQNTVLDYMIMTSLFSNLAYLRNQIRTLFKNKKIRYRMEKSPMCTCELLCTTKRTYTYSSVVKGVHQKKIRWQAILQGRPKEYDARQLLGPLGNECKFLMDS
jgi:hypothetical protein